ncbi:MAG: formyltransferase family protein [Aquirufa sp.]
MKNIVIFASGSGSNAEKIIEHFQGSQTVKITHIFCNNPEAGVIERAARLQIPCSVFSREEYKNGTLLRKIQSLQTDWIVLAGFLWLVPSEYVQAFPQRIINLHPSREKTLQGI